MGAPLAYIDFIGPSVLLGSTLLLLNNLPAKMYKEKHGVDPNLAIALDTKGPEIRTGLLEGDDGRKELTLKAGASIKITTDEAFKEKCTSEVLWLDYKNITKVMEPGKRLF